MSAYEKAGETGEWYTPRYVFEALGCSFDLDVAAPDEGPRYVPHRAWLSPEVDGLASPWSGFVWMNPPFGHQSQKRAWLARFILHGNGIALVPDRTSAPWWQEAVQCVDAHLQVAGKIKFERPDGTIGESPGTGTTLLACGKQAVEALHRAELAGLGLVFVRPAERP